MDREMLHSVISEQQNDFEEESRALLQREITSEIMPLLPLKLPICVTGVRRCGKSSLLKLIKNHLELGRKNYLYIDFSDERLIGFSADDFQKIIDFLSAENYGKGCFLFLDEIQELDNWEKWINRIKEKHPIFITGSNSKLLSSEISSTLTGRSLNTNLTPFSFREFLAARGIGLENYERDFATQSKIRKAFKDFLVSGGFPKMVFTNQKIILTELYENIIYRDVISKFNKNLSKPIKEISLFLLSNTSKPMSYRELSKMSGVKNISTVKSIVQALEDAFLFFLLNKFDYSVKKQVQNPRKVYSIDTGFVSCVAFAFLEDYGRLLENTVAIEFKRRKKDIYYFRENRECDFLIKEGRKITAAFQVCYALNESDRAREIGGLMEALQRFDLKSGAILTFDQEETLNVEGKPIHVKPVWKWMLE